jgi:hypothetical protein
MRQVQKNTAMYIGNVSTASKLKQHGKRKRVSKLEHFGTVPVLFQILGSESQGQLSCRKFFIEKMKRLIETLANLTFFIT